MVNKWYKEEIAFLNEDSPGQRMNDFIFLTYISYKEGGLQTAFCVLWEARCTTQMQREEENEIFLGAAKRIGSYQCEGSYLQS